mmetsp:Transcript_27186/g.41349  ORF Transcript_27186/g.41349 Transcript_27186/m.41349 type:complete len:178 (-) Transcript_27186:1343-1876(-)
MTAAVYTTLFLLLSVLLSSWGFHHAAARNTRQPLSMANNDDSFEITFDMPGSQGMIANLKMESVVSGKSELVEVRYNLPFGLDVSPKNGLAVCSKDGTGGEKVNDVLRFTSQWALGLPRGDGLMTTAASFAGGLAWQVSMFDVANANSWDQVVEALTSNVPDRTDEVVLIFERPLAE